MLQVAMYSMQLFILPSYKAIECWVVHKISHALSPWLHQLAHTHAGFTRSGILIG